MANELELLFEDRHINCEPWVIGKIPKHYKRISVSEKEALRLARYGATVMGAAFGVKLFYSQSIIAGAVLDPKYDEVVVVTPSQYGKTWLFGHLALYRAYQGAEQYVSGATGNVTQMIMSQAINSIAEASPEIQNALLIKSTELERLKSTISKQRLAFAAGGFVEAISLGDTYNDQILANKAIGRSGDFMIDEAAMVSNDAYAEMGRREFSRIDGKKYKMVMISNPHKPGVFYDKLTDPNPPKTRLILWMDALTAVEEERFSEDTVFHSDFARNRSTLRRYLLCVLDADGEGMFRTPDIYAAPYRDEYAQYFMGVDSAYTGKDNIEVCIAATGGGKIHIEEVIRIDKPDRNDWFEGETSEDIIRTIARIAKSKGVAYACVDEGWGVWLKEGLIRHGVNATGINFSAAPTRERQKSRHYSATNASNKRAEMHLDFQDLTDNDLLEVSEDVYREIKNVLPYVTAERKSNGKIVVRPKPEIKAIIGHSPDAFDAVLLSLHAAVLWLGDGVYAIP